MNEMLFAYPPRDVKSGSVCWLYRRPGYSGDADWLAMIWTEQRDGAKGWSIPLLSGTVDPEFLGYSGWRYHSIATPPNIASHPDEKPVMSFDEAKAEIRRLLNLWPADANAVGELRELLYPHRRLSETPVEKLRVVAEQLCALTASVQFRYAKPDPNGAASLLLS